MTEEELGELMLKRALKEGHRSRLPNAAFEFNYSAARAKERKGQIEDKICNILARKKRPMTMTEIWEFFSDDQQHAVETALRRMRTEGIIKSQYRTDTKSNRITWELA
jgi:hypothetical protein